MDSSRSSPGNISSSPLIIDSCTQTTTFIFALRIAAISLLNARVWKLLNQTGSKSGFFHWTGSPFVGFTSFWRTTHDSPPVLFYNFCSPLPRLGSYLRQSLKSNVKYSIDNIIIYNGLLYTQSGPHYRSVARPEYIQYIQQGNTTKCCPLYSIPYDIINISLRSWLTLQNTALGPTFRPSASTPTLGLHFVMLAAFGG